MLRANFIPSATSARMAASADLHRHSVSLRQLFILLLVFFFGFYAHAVLFSHARSSSSSSSALADTFSSQQSESHSSNLAVDNGVLEGPTNDEEIIVHIDPRELPQGEQPSETPCENDCSKCPTSTLPPADPPPPPFIPSPPPTRRSANFIMGISMGYPGEIVYRFVSTARHSCPTCEIRIFIDEEKARDDDVRRAMELSNAVIINVKEPIGGDKGVDKSAARYYLMRDWVHSYEADMQADTTMTIPSINMIFCIDVRDTVFQRDPFPLIPKFFDNYNSTQLHKEGKDIPWALNSESLGLPHRPLEVKGIKKIVWDGLQAEPWIIAFAEPSYATIGICSVNSAWTRDALPQHNLGEYLHKNIICSGALLGNLEGMKIYYTVMVKDLERMRSVDKLYHGVDQGVHMSLIYRRQFDPAIVLLASNDNCPLVNTLNFQRKIVRDAYGFLMASENPTEMVSAVHQIDRNKAIWNHWEPRFKVLKSTERLLTGK